MMSLEMDSERKFAKEFLAAKEKLDKIGFEIIGTKDIKGLNYFVVEEKNS